MPTVRQVEDLTHDSYASSKVVYMGNVIEVTTLTKEPSPPPCQKLDKDHFIDLRTGEVKEYEHGETRADSTKSIRRTLAHIRALVNTNVTDASRCRWVTLTYAENMTDTERLYQDFRKFWQRFKYWNARQGFTKPEYITVQEPQGRGAWHIHAFFIWPDKAPFIDNNSVMEKLWGHGFTSTKALADIDNIGAYFSAYLGDMPLDEALALPDCEKILALDAGHVIEKQFTNDREMTKEKKFIKGGRLGLYPAGMNIIRTTRGIKHPEVERMTYEEAQKKVSSAKLTFSRSYEIVLDDATVCNSLTKSYYNRSRK